MNRFVLHCILCILVNPVLASSQSTGVHYEFEDQCTGSEEGEECEYPDAPGPPVTGWLKGCKSIAVPRTDPETAIPGTWKCRCECSLEHLDEDESVIASE